MKKALVIALASICMSANAQDILVTDEGSSIKAYNVEVATNKIFYTLSPESEDSKSIQKSKVLVWKKADGTNVVLAQEDASDNSSVSTISATSSPNVQQPISEELISENKRQIAELNSRRVKFIGNNTGKPYFPEHVYTLNISPNSIIEDNNIKLSFSVKTLDASKKHKRYVDVLEKRKYSIPQNIVLYLATTIQNKTNRTIYVDLANCFALLGGIGTPFYTPSATQVSSGSSSGVSMNAGAVANALGVGGALGTLAGGLNVGGGSTSTTTNITYSQRVVSIPPMAALNLDPQYIGICKNPYELKIFPESKNIIEENFPSEYMVSGKKGERYPEYYELKTGEVFEIPDEKMTYPIGMAYCYSFSENLESPQLSRVDLGLKSVLGVRGFKSGYLRKNVDFSANPLSYTFYGSPMQTKAVKATK